MTAELQKDWQDDEINLFEYWQVVRKRTRMIIALVIVAVLAAGSHDYFIATKIYESKASILPPKESGGFGVAGGLGGTLAALGVASLFGGMATGGTSQTYMAMLKSRTMAEDLVARFNLKEYYKAKYTSQAIGAVQGSTTVSLSKTEGVITVKFEDKDPKFAAEMANAYITNLDRMFTKFGTTGASLQRAFIADRLEKTEKALRQAEDTLRRFQETNKTVVVQEEARGIIDLAARTKGEIIAAEVILESLRVYATENNPQVASQKVRIEELKRQLAQMQYGKGADLPSETRQPGQRRQEITFPVAKVPEISMEYVRLMREVKVQETVFTLLTAQFEQAKITESRDTPVVQLLDQAVPAEFESRPNVKLSMIVAGVLSLFVGIILALLLGYLDRLRTLGHSPAS